jgi:hypothetical protein
MQEVFSNYNNSCLRVNAGGEKPADDSLDPREICQWTLLGEVVLDQNFSGLMP